jgi:DNA-binding transcriptional LysR family regulator
MDFERLRLFHVVCAEGSVSRAAVRLFRTQPAVSMQLATLETEAGARLLSRTGRGVTPTAEGRRLLACTAELLRAYDRLHETWSGQLGGGDLDVAASDTVARHFLPAALRALVRQRPALRVHLVQSATPESVSLLRSGQVELAFLLLPIADPRLSHEVVLRYRHVAAYPRGTRASGPVQPEELARGPLVLLSRGTHTRQLVDEALRSRGLSPSHVLEVGSVSIQKAMIRCGLGAGIVPEYAIEKQDRLVTRPISGASVREIAVARRSDFPLTGAAEAALVQIRAEAARRTTQREQSSRRAR